MLTPSVSPDCSASRPWVRLALGLAAVGLAACGGPAAGPADPAPRLALRECRVSGIDTAVRCATLPVWENRVTRTGRQIDLSIVVLPAAARIKEPDPIFLFAGGPGQAAGDLAAQARAMLGGLNDKRDIVLVDQRGTGKSHPLHCRFPRTDTDRYSDLAQMRAATGAAVDACRETLAQRADLTQYTSTIAMADYDEVRAALGVDKINLWGGSYGTRTAQEYLRRYPDRVRSVVLDGVAAPAMALSATFARDASASFEALLRACEAGAVCRSQYAALRTDIDTLLASLAAKPRRMTVADPLTGIPRDVVVLREGVAMAIFSSLYVPTLAAVLPEALTQAKAGNFAPLMALGGAFADAADDKMAMGMRFSVACNEDVPRIDEAARTAATGQRPFGSFFIDEFRHACQGWPRATVPADFFTPVRSDAPVLILSGGLDPVTPPIFGEEVKKGFSRARHLVAPHVGHIVSPHACGPRLIKQFIERADASGLDGQCLAAIPRPSFYLPMLEKPERPERTESPERQPDNRRAETAK